MLFDGPLQSPSLTHRRVCRAHHDAVQARKSANIRDKIFGNIVGREERKESSRGGFGVMRGRRETRLFRPASYAGRGSSERWETKDKDDHAPRPEELQETWSFRQVASLFLTRRIFRSCRSTRIKESSFRTEVVGGRNNMSMRDAIRSFCLLFPALPSR